MARSSVRKAGLLLLLILLPAAAQAHTVLPGSGDLANGLLDPLFTPSHVLLVLALGLWLGQRQPLRLLEPSAAFSAGAALGLGLTLAISAPPLVAAVALLALVAGGLVALAAPGRRWLDVGLYAASGVVLGLDSHAEAAAGHSGLLMLLGSWISLSVLLVNIAFYVSLLPPRPWARIGVRIAGSWLFAISLLLIAFALRR